MATLRYEIRSYISREQYLRLQHEAAARRCSLSQCVRDCLYEYLALKEEMATAIASPGKPGEMQSGIIHTLLARSEERIVRTLSAVHTDVRVLHAMADRAALSYFLHTPEIPDGQKQAALMSGRRRYVQWRQAVERVFAEEGPARGEEEDV